MAGILLGYEFCVPQSTSRVDSIQDEFSSLAFSVTKRWPPGKRFAALGSIGYQRAEWSSSDDVERYRIYRNDAAPRFCAQNDLSGFGGYCPTLEGFLPGNAFDDDDWFWWTTALTWRPNTGSWSFVLRAEDGGTRDWRILTDEVRYHW